MGDGRGRLPGDGIRQRLHRAGASPQNGHCLEGAIGGDRGLAAVAIKGAFFRRLAPVEGIVDGCARSGRGQRDLGAGLHRAALGLRLGRCHGDSGLAVQLIKGKLVGISAGISLDRCCFVATELILASLIAGEMYRIVPLTAEHKFSVFERPAPAVFLFLDAVVIAAFGRDKFAVGILEGHFLAGDGQRPYRAGRRVSCRDGAHPGAVQHAGGVSRVGEHIILTRRELLLRGHLGKGFCRHGSRRKQPQAQNQRQEHGQRAMCIASCQLMHSVHPFFR